jgi:hypothetical protein
VRYVDEDLEASRGGLSSAFETIPGSSEENKRF